MKLDRSEKSWLIGIARFAATGTATEVVEQPRAAHDPPMHIRETASA